MKHIGRSFPETTPETTAGLDTPDAPELESLTVAQLKELALADGIDLGSAKTKAEIIAAFNEAME